MPESPWSSAGPVLLAGGLALSLPAQVYYGNSDEFAFYFYHAAGYLFPCVAVVLPVLYFCLARLSPTQRRGASVVLAMLGCAAWVQGNFLLWDYGVFKGTPIDWTAYRCPGLIDAALWLSLLVFGFVRRARLYPHLGTLCLGCLLHQALVVAFLAVPQALVERPFKSYVRDGTKLWDFSAKANAVVLVLDSFQAGAFAQISAEDSGLTTGLSGFTFFPDTVGSFPSTYPSPTVILTGKTYDNSVPVQEFISAAFQSRSSLPRAFQEAGYTVDILASSGQTVPVEPTVGAALRRRGWLALQELLPLLRASLFRAVPHFAKQAFFSGGGAPLVSPVGHGADVRFFLPPDQPGADVPFFLEPIEARASARASQPAFKFFHLRGVHPPFCLNESLLPEQLGVGLVAYRRQAKAMLVLVRRFLDRLRRIGAYDNSLIFVLGDHGHDFGTVVEQGTPLLLAKPPNAHGPLAVSSAAVSLADVAATAIAVLELPAVSEPGTRSLFGPPADVRRPRRFMSYQWEHRFWGLDQRYLPEMREYLVRGPALEPSSWQATGRRFTSGRILEPRTYPWGAEVDFRLVREVAPAVTAVGFDRELLCAGWAAAMVMTQPKAQLAVELPFAPSRDGLSVELEVEPLRLGPDGSCEVAVEVGGERVATHALAERATVQSYVPVRLLGAVPTLRLTLSARGSASGPLLVLHRVRVREVASATSVDAREYQREGWWTPEPGHTWTQTSAELSIPIAPPEGDLELEATLFPFTFSTITEQRVTVSANGTPVATWCLTGFGSPGTHRATIPCAAAREDARLRLGFRVSRPASPRDVGFRDDARVLGLAFRSLILRPRSIPSAPGPRVSR